MARPIRMFGDPVLRTPADEVVEFDESLAQLVDDMFASMYAAEGVGLAANQIGVGPVGVRLRLPGRLGHAPRRARGEPGAGLRRRRGGRRLRGLPVDPRPALRDRARVVRGGRGHGRRPAPRSGTSATASSPAACSTRPTTCTACCSWTGCAGGPSARRCARSSPPTGPTASGLLSPSGASTGRRRQVLLRRRGDRRRHRPRHLRVEHARHHVRRVELLVGHHRGQRRRRGQQHRGGDVAAPARPAARGRRPGNASTLLIWFG